MPFYRMVIQNTRTGDVWTEDYDLKSPAQAQQMIDIFNANLRPGEDERKLIDLGEIAEEGERRYIKHEWRKTNLVTILRRGQMFDTYRCTRCGVTGKRFGLGGSVIRDRKYQAKKYEGCKVEE